MGLISNIVTRFPNGITNAEVGSIFNGLPFLDPTVNHTFMDDFDIYAAADWTVTVVGTGTAALINFNNGILTLLNSAADNDAVFLQKVGASFLPTPGKPMFFRARIALLEVIQADVVAGLQVIGATPLDPTDGIYFLKPDGTAGLSFVVRKDATTGSVAVASIANMVPGVFTSLSWYYDGIDRVYYAVDDTVLGAIDLGSSGAYLPDTVLTPTFGVQNGQAVANSLGVDLIFASAQR